MESYRILDVDYRRFQRENASGLSCLWSYFQDIWWQYGYKPGRVFLWTLGLLILFTLVNLALYRRLTEQVYRINFVDYSLRAHLWWLSRLGIMMFRAFVYTSIVFFDLKMDISKFQRYALKEHPVLFAYLMIVYVSGLICLGFIVNLIFTK